MGVILTPLLGSCTSDDVVGGAGREECDIILGQPMTVTSATRATDGSPSSTQFEPNEIVWLWANKADGSEYITAWQLTAQSGGSLTGSSAKYWPSDGSHLNVYALHGNFENSSSISEGTTKWSNLSLTHTVKTDQTSPENKRLSDLLFAEKAGATHGNNVELSFSHLLAKITVKLDLNNSEGIESSELNNATVTLTNIQPKATISNKSLTENSEKTNTTGTHTTITAGKITSSITSGDVIGSAIVPLQQFGGVKNDASQNNVITITLASPDNRSFSYKPETNVALSAGMEYTYTLKIIGNKITGSLSVSPFSSEDKPISFKDYFDYLADLKNRNCLGSSGAPHDLSYDYNGQMNTANCYVVTHPGYYKFPLVYGNAIKNGATNAIAYGVGTNSTTFVNHLDQPIEDPYIYKNSGCTVGSAELVWQDAQNLISDISLCDEQKYIKFQITKENIEQGNAVIAVKDESGAIMWSWHIWVTNKNVYETVPIKTVALSGLTTEHTYNFMPVALGWDDDDIEHPNCPYYQWGRKDPFCPSDGTTDNKDKTLYDISGNNVNLTLTKAPVTTSTAIKNPFIYYYFNGDDSSNHDWNNTTYYDYWNATNGNNTEINDNEVVKTVYDPNPVGYKMPSRVAFTGFTQDGGLQNDNSKWNVKSTTFDNGYKFYTQGWKNEPTDFWIAIGERSWYNGFMRFSGSEGSYWTAGPNSPTASCHLNITNEHVSPRNNGYRISGMPVRPVSE